MTIFRHRNLSDLEIVETEPSAADEMPIVIQLAQNDVANIQSSWTLIEPILLKVRPFFCFKRCIMTQLEHIYNSHYGNGVPAMFTPYVGNFCFSGPLIPSP